MNEATNQRVKDAIPEGLNLHQMHQILSLFRFHHALSDDSLDYAIAQLFQYRDPEHGAQAWQNIVDTFALYGIEEGAV